MQVCIKRTFAKAAKPVYDGEEMKPVEFSLVGLFNGYKEHQQMDLTAKEVSLHDVEDALLYLSKIEALRLEGGFWFFTTVWKLNAA